MEAKRANKDVAGVLQQAQRYCRDVQAGEESDLKSGGWGPEGEARIPFAFSTNGRPAARLPARGVGSVRAEAGYGGAMGLIRGSFSLSNPTRPDLAPMEVSALVDSGAVHLCIPEHLAIQLSLAELERREVVLADGHRRTVPYVGPVEVRFRNRRCFTGAMVLGNEVLLGAIPMEDMDLVLRPSCRAWM